MRSLEEYRYQENLVQTVGGIFAKSAYLPSDAEFRWTEEIDDLKLTLRLYVGSSCYGMADVMTKDTPDERYKARQHILNQLFLSAIVQAASKFKLKEHPNHWHTVPVWAAIAKSEGWAKITV